MFLDLEDYSADVLPHSSVTCNNSLSDITVASVSSLATPKMKKPKTVFLCDFCDKTFDFKSLLERHVVKHTGETPFSCNKCGRSFRHQGSVSNHLCGIVPSQLNNET